MAQFGMNGIQNFLMRHQTAMKSNSKEMRLTITEASDLATNIALILERNSSYLEELKTQTQISGNVEVVADGGNSW